MCGSCRARGIFIEDAVIPGMNAIAFTREVRAVFGEPRRIGAVSVAILRDARKSALLRMTVYAATEFVMAGLVPAIHVLVAAVEKDVDARDKPGQDIEIYGPDEAQSPVT